MTPNKQSVTVHQDLLRDISQLRVRNADGGTFRLMMLKNDLKYFQSAEIVSGGATGGVRDAIKAFYSGEFGTDP